MQTKRYITCVDRTGELAFGDMGLELVVVVGTLATSFMTLEKEESMLEQNLIPMMALQSCVILQLTLYIEEHEWHSYGKYHLLKLP